MTRLALARAASGATLSLLFLACSSTTTGAGLGSTSGATSSQVSQCHTGCDQMKFFNCSTAAELSRCYDDCGSAAPSKIDAFNGCSQTSICDPQCRDIIEPPSSNGTSGATTGGGGVAASDCQTACDKLVKTCSFIPVGQESTCVSQCQQYGYQYQIDCVNNNQCSDIQKRCGAPGGSSGGTGTSGGDAGTTDPNVLQCQSSCTDLKLRDCLTTDEVNTCNANCASISGPSRSTFEMCEGMSADCMAAHDCFAAFK